MSYRSLIGFEGTRVGQERQEKARKSKKTLADLPDDSRLALSVAAQLARVHYRTLKAAADSGVLATFRHHPEGVRRYVTVGELRRYLSEGVTGVRDESARVRRDGGAETAR